MKHTFGIIQSGILAGRQIIIPQDKDGNVIHDQKIVLVQKGMLFGKRHFAPACLLHGIFIPQNGCPKCNREEKSGKAG